MSDTRRRAVYRYEVPVDDQWHSFILRGPVLHVDSRDPGMVEMWTLDDSSFPEQAREFVAVGTGHVVPEDAGEHVGSVIVADGALVWHLFERAS